MEEHRCGRCGRVFGSTKTLEEHSRIEHSGKQVLEAEKSLDLKVPSVQFNRMFLLGVFAGLLIAGTAFAGFTYWNSLDHPETVTVTVVTCDNCSYGKFRNATARIFKTDYREFNYRSDKGQKLIQKYDLNYVPGFIFDSDVEKAANFSRVKPVLVKFDDAYVLPDRGNRAAQRMSRGMPLE